MPLNNGKYFHQKYADKGEKHNFPLFYQDHQFCKIGGPAIHDNAKSKMFSIDCISQRKL